MTSLGSRDQLCLDVEVRKVSGSAQGLLCRKKVYSKTCGYYKENEKITQIMDIEELVQYGANKVSCPFYLARNTILDAEIIFMPYNYLIDQKHRKSLNIWLKDAIVIFDEAHNLASACSDAASIEITSYDLNQCVIEAKQCLETAQYIEEKKEKPLSAAKQVYETMLDIKHSFDSLIRDGGPSITETGSFFYSFLQNHQINSNTCAEFVQKLKEMVELVLQDQKSSALSRFAECLETVYRDEIRLDLSLLKTHFKVFISRESGKTTMSFWCFYAGLAMRDIVRGGVRSLILASGTLSPMTAFETEIGVDFRQKLEGKHVIDSSQILAGILPNGPNGSQLSSAFNIRSQDGYQSELGDSVSQLCGFIPGGVLAFFPSYSAMMGSIKHWSEKSNHMHQIKLKKQVFVEPKTKTEFVKVMKMFTLASKKGAILFGVCRGKVSEGIDFSDAMGRAVLILGIPYPNCKDPRVDLQKKYVEETTIETGSSWYQLQALRAVNQAIGRVIRHKNDYAAIILLDSRFQDQRTQKQLSKWVQPFMKTHDHFSGFLLHLSKFFKVKPQVESPLVPQKRKAVMIEHKPIKYPVNLWSSESLPEPKTTRPSLMSLFGNPNKNL